MSRRLVARKSSGHMMNFLVSRKRRLKEELDRIYYTMPYENIRALLLEMKDTIDSLSDLGESREDARATQQRAA